MTKDLRIEKLGEVFTLPSVVKHMLDLIDYKSCENLANTTVLEPSAGDGAFAIEIVNRLKQSSVRHQFSLTASLSNICFVEIDLHNIETLKNRLVEECRLTQKEVSLISLIHGDFLLTKFSRRFDVVVGNPPYVRWDNIDSNYRNILSLKFSTFSGRCDLYIPFYEKGLNLLETKGLITFICSNRWFKSAYGKRLRELVVSKYAMSKVIDLEATNPFTIDVLGYPAITVIRNSIYCKTNYKKIDALSELFSPIVGVDVRLDKFRKCIWTFDDTYNNLLSTKHYAKIQDSGYKINIGVATGKDKVFISKDFSGRIEEDRLVPLLKGQHLKEEIIDSKLKVINCFNEQGRLVNLEDYPKLNLYLKEYEHLLKDRHVARKNKASWFRTIDKIRYRDIDANKILLPDITGGGRISLGGKGYYPHHNVYYITTSISLFHLEVLAAVLSSQFIVDQLALVGNTMNGGYPRWQSQNIKRLVIPNVLSMREQWKSKMSKAYRADDMEAINILMTKEEIVRSFVDETSYLLFEPEAKYSQSTT